MVVSGIREILKSGHAPGIKTNALDPGCPKAAVPRALRQLEQTEHHSRIAHSAGYSTNRLKKIWKI